MKKLAFLLLVAALPAFLHAQTDDFNDGNDAGWTRFNPIGVGSFSVVNGGYRLQTSPSPNPGAFVVPMRLRTEVGELAFLSTTTVFGTPVEVTLSELAIESFFPANPKTATALRTMSLVGRVLRFPLSLRPKKTGGT